ALLQVEEVGVVHPDRRIGRCGEHHALGGVARAAAAVRRAGTARLERVVVVHVHSGRGRAGGRRAPQPQPLVEVIDRVRAGAYQVGEAVEVGRYRLDLDAGVADEVADVRARRHAEVLVVGAGIGDEPE